ncbi:MAG: YifB family Mg chelatase-like AAA ATPase [Dorea sp.]|nr:YifB family Mg chelatase-like AAA ATPase [Dorea sp.]
MSFGTIMSAAIEGLHVEMVQVETDISNGLPVFHMVGYLSSEVKEASERVRTAMHNSGIQIPAKKIIINLSPAAVRKRGSSFDLPIALSLLCALGEIEEEKLKDTAVIGELSLDGKVREVKGVLPIVMEARKQGIRRCILPKGNALEGALTEGIQVIGVESLGQAADCLKREEEFPLQGDKRRESCASLADSRMDFSEIQGQESVKRAVETAVSGGHNLLLIGPPGSGKSMIAQRIPTILPPPDHNESLEITKIYSVLGMVDRKRPLITGRPFRSVHHTVTKSALIGGGLVPSPGEISLAHGGVLFLDELAEFKKPVLEVLRQPLEERKIHINRVHGNYVFPSDFMLVAAMNPCPCGNFPDFSKCSCTPWQVGQYLGRISQPFLDRIDICVEAPRIRYEEIRERRRQESSADIRKRVIAARDIQQKRYEGQKILNNSMMGIREIDKYCRLGREEEHLMRQVFTSMNLTARTYHKILKVARTIADMDGGGPIRMVHLKEATGYRTMDKKYWGR